MYVLLSQALFSIFITCVHRLRMPSAYNEFGDVNLENWPIECEWIEYMENGRVSRWVFIIEP